MLENQALESKMHEIKLLDFLRNNYSASYCMKKTKGEELIMINKEA